MKRIIGAFLFLVLWTMGIISLCGKYSAPRVYFTPGPDCETNIIHEINRATRIDIAVYSITNKNISRAIISAHNRGAHVRIISDRTMAGGRGSQIATFRNAGIHVITNTHHKIMHNKFAIFDGRRVVTGSYNWTINATDSNAENCVFIPDPAKTFAAGFDYLWNLYSE